MAVNSENTVEKRVKGESVSVVMSVYKETIDVLSDAVNSILQQSYRNYDFIIVIDDPENVEAIEYLKAKSATDPRIKLIENSENMGLARSLNTGIAMSESEYIMRMDADDISYEDRLKIEIAEIVSRHCDVVFSDYRYIDKAGNVHGRKDAKVKDPKKQMMISNIIHHPTSLFRKAIFDKVGGYRDFPCSQDYDLWLRMLEAGGSFFYIDRCLLDYRITNNSVSQSKASLQALTTAYIKRLFFGRRISKEDNYSVEDYKKYIKRYTSEIENKEFSLYVKKELRKAKAMTNRGMKLSSFIVKANILRQSACYRKFYFYKTISKLYVAFIR